MKTCMFSCILFPHDIIVEKGLLFFTGGLESVGGEFSENWDRYDLHVFEE